MPPGEEEEEEEGEGEEEEEEEVIGIYSINTIRHLQDSCNVSHLYICRPLILKPLSNCLIDLVCIVIICIFEFVMLPVRTCMFEILYVV